MSGPPWIETGALDDLLLSGRLAPEAAPAELRGVAELVRALKAPPTALELAGRESAVAAASLLLAERAATLPRPRAPGRTSAATPRRRSRLRRVKVASLVVAGTLLGTAGLAAAGVLPDPVQEVVHRILGAVGIEAPSGDRPAETPGTSNGTTPPIVATPDAAGGPVRSGADHAPPTDVGTTDTQPPQGVVPQDEIVPPPVVEPPEETGPPDETGPPAVTGANGKSGDHDPGPPAGHGPPNDPGPPAGHGPPEGQGPSGAQGPPDDQGPPNDPGPPNDLGPPDDQGPPIDPGPPADPGPPDHAAR